MGTTLQHNIRELGVFTLIAAAAGLLMIPAVRISGYFSGAPAVLIILYTIWNIFILVWSSIRIILKLPLKESWRTFIFFLWLIFYPVVCTLYCAICSFLSIYVFNTH